MKKKKSRNLTGIQKAGIVIVAIMIVNFIENSISLAVRGEWKIFVGQLVTLVVILILVYLFRDSLRQLWENIKQGKRATRDEFEKSQGQVNLKNAAVFALTWSREIYHGIPADRRPLVKASFTLIGIALGIVLLHMSSPGILVVLAIGLLILAGVNLLIWVVGSEREDKDRMAVELDTARKMQLSLMPDHDPEVRGFDVSGCCIPAQNVGGDMFDFVWVRKEQNKLCITVADVAGKGMDAALTAVYTSGALVSETQHEENVVTVVDNLNSAIYSRQNRSRFVSVLVAVLDVSSRTLEFVNAGQSRPLLVKNNQISVLKTEGVRFPLGVIKTPQYQQQMLSLSPGDILLIYTDGVTDAIDSNEEMFGNERLEILLAKLVRQNLCARGMVQEIKDEILRFSGTAQQNDDITLVVIKAL